MTESEWLACTDPEPMMKFLRGRASDRKVRLFAVACCRRVWPSLEHEEFRDAVRKAESFADGLADRDEMLQAHGKASAIFRGLHGRDNGPGAALTASGFPRSPKSLLERIADALDDPWWEDEFDKGDRSLPHSSARGTRLVRRRIFKARDWASMILPRQSPSTERRLPSHAVFSETHSVRGRCATPG